MGGAQIFLEELIARQRQQEMGHQETALTAPVTRPRREPQARNRTQGKGRTQGQGFFLSQVLPGDEEVHHHRHPGQQW